MSQPFDFSQATALTAASGIDVAMQMNDTHETTMEEETQIQEMEQDSQETAMQDDSQETVMDRDSQGTDDGPPPPAHDSPQGVIASIESIVASIIDYLDNEVSPILTSDNLTRRFTLSQSRSFTSIVMVLSFSHSLLQSGRTTTTREVYYFFVTHFRNQRECDAAILDAANLLGVPRSSLGLYASPKGKSVCVVIILA